MSTRTFKTTLDRFRSPRPRRRFAIERLESRLLLSADLLPEGVLQITGTEGNDTVLMQAFEPEEGTPQLAVTLNGETFRYDLEGIGEIRVDAQAGAAQRQIDERAAEHPSPRRQHHRGLAVGGIAVPPPPLAIS